MKSIGTDVIGSSYKASNSVDNLELIKVNDAIRNHPIEAVGKHLRTAMTAMKRIKSTSVVNGISTH